MEFGVPLRLVDVMNLIRILGRPSNIQWRESYLCDFVKKNKKQKNKNNKKQKQKTQTQQQQQTNKTKEKTTTTTKQQQQTIKLTSKHKIDFRCI